MPGDTVHHSHTFNGPPLGGSSAIEAADHEAAIVLARQLPEAAAPALGRQRAGLLHLRYGRFPTPETKDPLVQPVQRQGSALDPLKAEP